MCRFRKFASQKAHVFQLRWWFGFSSFPWTVGESRVWHAPCECWSICQSPPPPPPHMGGLLLLTERIVLATRQSRLCRPRTVYRLSLSFAPVAALPNAFSPILCLLRDSRVLTQPQMQRSFFLFCSVKPVECNYAKRYEHMEVIGGFRTSGWVEPGGNARGKWDKVMATSLSSSRRPHI